MTSAYAAIIRQNTATLFSMDLDERAAALPARRDAFGLHFQAFGQPCSVHAGGLTLNQIEETGPKGIIISLYALNAKADACIREPFKSFKELPDSMPYAGAFANRTEQALCRIVGRLPDALPKISALLDGASAPPGLGGDWSFVVYPLPKIALCYLCYAADEDFPAAVTCLFSHNAQRFMPTDGLADVAEYTSKTIIEATG